ncbi:MAG: hypothetical protein J5707_00105 [Candidatus Methanomethylophilus sp.]|nr:hypothetical protein [Methanomethylophilus sp.]
MNANVNNHSAAFGWIGVLAVTAFCAMWLICYLADSSWTWGINTISDFGVSSAAADYFNYGVVLFGMILAVYGLGKTQSSAVTSRVSGNLIAIGAIFIALMGLFTVDIQNGDYHKLVALVGAGLLVLGLMLSAVQSYFDGKILAVGFAIGIFIAMFFCATQFGYAKGEVYCLVLAVIWGLVDSAFMITDGINNGAVTQ